MKKLLPLPALLLLASLPPATAADLYWEAGANGVFSDANSWLPGNVVPGTSDTAINASAHTVTINADWNVQNIKSSHLTTEESTASRFLQTGGAVTASNWFRLGEDSGSIGIYEISGGTLTASASINNSAVRIGGNGLGILKISGTNTVVNIAPGTNGWNDALRIGNGGGIYSGGEGRVIQENGTVNAGRVLIGQDAGGNGSYSLSGGTLNASGDTYVGGYNGTGTLTITGGTFSGYKLHVSQEGGTGTFTMSGGQVSLSSWFIVGHKTGNSWGTGVATISAGTLSANHEAAIGNELGTGVLTLSGGTLNAASFFCIGRQGGTGTLNITGGTLNQNGGGFVVGGDWSNGNSSGTVNHSAGSLISAASIKIGADAKTNKGTYNLSGTGEIRITSSNWLLLGGNGTEGVLNMTGGTITHEGSVTSDITSRVSIGDGKRENGSTYTEGTINQSGGIFTATGVDTDIGRNGGSGAWTLSGTGVTSLRVLNLGSDAEASGVFNLQTGGKLTLSGLTLGGNGNSAFNFDGGTLTAADDMAISMGIGSINVLANGGTIDNGGHTVTIEHALTGSGNLTLKGNGSMKIEVDCALSGHVIVEQGTLVLATAGALDGLDGLSFASGTTLELDYDGIANLGFLLVNGTYVAAGEYTLTELQDYLTANGLDGDLTLVGYQDDYSKVNISAVPEPSTYALLGATGFLGLIMLRRRKKS